ncbi:hypothetical protein ES703_118420 [subsurface metagenome]
MWPFGSWFFYSRKMDGARPRCALFSVVYKADVPSSSPNERLLARLILHLFRFEWVATRYPSRTIQGLRHIPTLPSLIPCLSTIMCTLGTTWITSTRRTFTGSSSARKGFNSPDRLKNWTARFATRTEKSTQRKMLRLEISPTALRLMSIWNGNPLKMSRAKYSRRTQRSPIDSEHWKRQQKLRIRTHSQKSRCLRSRPISSQS